MAYPGERELYEELLVGGFTIIEVSLVAKIHDPVDKLGVTLGSRLSERLSSLGIGLEKRHGGRVARHHEVAHIVGQSVDEKLRIEALVANLLVYHP